MTDTRQAIQVGDTTQNSLHVTHHDVRTFAALTGDENPLHLDGDYAERTRFEERIAHGVLVDGVISGALADLDGCIILLSLDTEYHEPVTLDSELVAEVTVSEEIGDGMYRCTAEAELEDGPVVANASALILVEDV